MRVTSQIWVHVFLRAEQNRGAMVMVAQKGALEAGAIYICWENATGEWSLFGPAPQSMLENAGTQRQYETVLENASEAECAQYLERQRNFDPDIWILEVQSRDKPDLDIAG